MIDQDLSISEVQDVPCSSVGVSGSLEAVDPASGHLLLFCGDKTAWEWDPDKNGEVDAWTEFTGSEPPVWSDEGVHTPIEYQTAATIEEYGVIVFWVCQGGDLTNPPCEFVVYKHTTDTFTALCADTSTVACRTFDSLPSYGIQSDIDEGYFVNSYGSCPTVTGTGRRCPEIENGTLKFFIQSESDYGGGGQWFLNACELYGFCITEGGSGYFAFEYKVDDFYLTHDFGLTDESADAFKLFIFGDPDDSSCSTNEIVLQADQSDDIPSAYHSCGSPSDVFEQGTSTITKQPGGEYESTCIYPGPYTGSNCYHFVSDEWLKVQVGIIDNTSGTDDEVFIWVAQEADTEWTLVYHTDFFEFDEDTVAGRGHGLIWLLPFFTGKDGSEVHQTTYVWYDNLIISNTKITRPTFAQGIH